MATKKKLELEETISKVLFGSIIVYAAVTVYILLWRWIKVLPGLPATGDDSMWIYYAIYSFVMAIVISVFHLSISLLQRKKKRDS